MLCKQPGEQFGSGKGRIPTVVIGIGKDRERRGSSSTLDRQGHDG